MVVKAKVTLTGLSNTEWTRSRSATFGPVSVVASVDAADAFTGLEVRSVGPLSPDEAKQLLVFLQEVML